MKNLDTSRVRLGILVEPELRGDVQRQTDDAAALLDPTFDSFKPVSLDIPYPVPMMAR